MDNNSLISMLEDIKHEINKKDLIILNLQKENELLKNMNANLQRNNTINKNIKEFNNIKFIFENYEIIDIPGKYIHIDKFHVNEDYIIDDIILIIKAEDISFDRFLQYNDIALLEINNNSYNVIWEDKDPRNGEENIYQTVSLTENSENNLKTLIISISKHNKKNSIY